MVDGHAHAARRRCATCGCSQRGDGVPAIRPAALAHAWRENVGLGLELGGRARSASGRSGSREQLELVGLSDWADRKVGELSGGMQQRVGLARAFATEAPILLMDEPFSALDPLIRTRLQDELLELQQRLQRTIIFVSHDLDEAFKLGDRIAIMEGGRIVQCGTPREIFSDPANDYVADFVANMNPLGVLTRARRDGAARGRSRARRVDADARLSDVMGLLNGRPAGGGGDDGRSSATSPRAGCWRELTTRWCHGVTPPRPPPDALRARAGRKYRGRPWVMRAASARGAPGEHRLAPGDEADGGDDDRRRPPAPRVRAARRRRAQPSSAAQMSCRNVTGWVTVTGAARKASVIV